MSPPVLIQGWSHHPAAQKEKTERFRCYTRKTHPLTSRRRGVQPQPIGLTFSEGLVSRESSW